MATSTEATARIVRPLTGGDHGWAFAGSLADLDSIGYQQTEYLIEGTARRFRPTGPLGFDGRWQVEGVEPTPFRTRLLVTAPVDPARSNGTLLFEWANVSAGFDTLICDGPDILATGNTHVAVSAQRLGAHGYPDAPMGLVQWDPERYGTLSIPGDTYSYDIFSQAARLLGQLDAVSRLSITRTVAVGVSQSAGRVATYFNAIQPIEQIFDAFLLVGYFGAGASIEDDAMVDLRTVQSSTQRAATPLAQLRDDLGVPVLVVNSEAEVLPHFPVRQPDSDTYRLWEVAGTPHTPPDMLGFAAKIARDKIEMPTTEAPADAPPRCETTWWPAYLASMDHFQRWIHGGRPVPSQPLVEVAGSPPAIQRDEHGIARGGIRLPAVDAPLASHQGHVDIPGAGRLSGASLPLGDDVLRSLYPDRATYLERYEASLLRGLDRGVIRAADAAALRQEAAAAVLPT